MKSVTTAAMVLLVFGLMFSTDAEAKTKVLQFSAADVINDPANAPRLAGVTFYFGDTPHPPIVESFGEYRTNKKTNGFGKDAKEACDWVMMSALLTLHQRAVSLGANAVVNIRSNFKNNETRSDTDYACGKGFALAGVALIGDFVTVEE